MIARRIHKDVGEWMAEVQWQAKQRTAPAWAGQPDQPGTWLILADAQGVGAKLAAKLKLHEQRCVLVAAGDTFQRVADDQYCVRPTEPEDMRRLLAECLGDEFPACRGVVHLWIDGAQAQPAPNRPGRRACPRCCAVSGPAGRLPSGDTPRLVATRACAVTADGGPIDRAQAALWGLGRHCPEQPKRAHAPDLIRPSVAESRSPDYGDLGRGSRRPGGLAMNRFAARSVLRRQEVGSLQIPADRAYQLRRGTALTT